MEHCSILSDLVQYVQHDQDPKKLHKLSIKALDYGNHKKLCDKLKKEERQNLDIDFGDILDKLMRTYLDMYKRAHAEVLHSAKFNECSDLSTTYLGKTYMMREIKIKAEENFPISGQGYMDGKLLDDTECQILLDTGAS